MMGPKVQRYATIVRDRVSPDGQKKNRVIRDKETMARKNRQNCMRVIERIEMTYHLSRSSTSSSGPINMASHKRQLATRPSQSNWEGVNRIERRDELTGGGRREGDVDVE